MLDANQIEFYETPPGLWGLSLPGLWIRDESRREQAQELIARYQQESMVRAREHYEELKAQGLQATLWDALKLHPLRVIGVVVGITFILYLTLFPFLHLRPH